MEVGLPLTESPLESDWMRPPKMPARTSVDGASIALYVLSIIGLVLFIVVMIMYIVHTIIVTKQQKELAQRRNGG